MAGWARVHGLAGTERDRARSFACDERASSGQAGAGPGAGGGANDGALAIVYPADGARFLLDPGRPAAHQMPPLRAVPAGAPVRWTVDGAAAGEWVPSRGEHVVRATLAGLERSVTVAFE